MRGMGHAAGHHPGSRAPDIEEYGFPFPPSLLFLLERYTTLAAVFRITFHKFQADFLFRQWRRPYVDPEHVTKPDVFTDALVHHVFVDAASPWINGIGADRKILVFEHAPRTDHLCALGFVSVDQELIFHSWTS